MRCTLIALALAACSDNRGPDIPAPTSAAPPVASEIVYAPIDETRGTVALPVVEIPVPHRRTVLAAQWHLPQESPKLPPVVVWSHGGGSPVGMHKGGRRWAEAMAMEGFAVLRIIHRRRDPDEIARMCPGLIVGSDGKPLKVGDCASFVDFRRRYDKALDVAGALNQLELIAGKAGASVDVKRVAVAGHGDGAAAALALAGGRRAIGAIRPDLSHPLPRAFVAISAAGAEAETGWDEDSFADARGPILLITGAGDDNGLAGRGWKRRVALFELLPAPSSRLFVPSERARPGELNLAGRSDAFVVPLRSTVVAFLDAHLRDGESAKSYLASGALAELAEQAAASERLTSYRAKRRPHAEGRLFAVPTWCRKLVSQPAPVCHGNAAAPPSSVVP
ncbi:MAG: hypothetical protein AAGA56_22870 [Myxococcota bacterium]